MGHAVLPDRRLMPDVISCLAPANDEEIVDTGLYRLPADPDNDHARHKKGIHSCVGVAHDH